MSCVTCSGLSGGGGTGSPVPSPSALISVGGPGTVAPVNPLTGLPLATGQLLVTGPPWSSSGLGGPRQTVVNRASPQLWPPWISNVMGQPTDRGDRAGGTWDGPQQLPEIQVTARPWPWLLIGGLGLVWFWSQS